MEQSSNIFQNSLNRDIRYELPHDLYVMARPFGMKFYNFELVCTDVSSTGMLLISSGLGFVPFIKKNRLNCTFDFSGKTFGRPIHMIVVVMRVGITPQGNQFFGTRIEAIDKNHAKYFNHTLANLPTLDQSADTYYIAEKK